jgi:anti-sigma B factor antagonist
VRDFTVAVTEKQSDAVIAVAGELDMYTAPRLRDQLMELVARGTQSVTVDLGDVDFIDSTALGVLIAGLKRLREYGGDLKLRSPNPNALKTLEITGLTKVFTID